MDVAVEIQDLTVSYRGVVALRDVSLTVKRSEKVAVVGPNGAGKSTLFKAIVGLIPIQHGAVHVLDGSARRGIAFVPQHTQVDLKFPVSVSDVVLMGRIGHIGWLRWGSGTDREAVKTALEQVGLVSLAGRRLWELSGGQRQRVFIARALTQGAGILLMDEPFSGIDLPSQDTILRILDELTQDGITILLSTHDLNLAVERFDRLALLNRRLVAFGESRTVITPETLMATYGGQAVWKGEDYAMVVGDIGCCDASREQHETHG